MTILTGLDLESLRFRQDGWPLCPRCGEDELMSLEIEPKPTDWLKCLACGWSGELPPKGVVDVLTGGRSVLSGL